MALTDQDKLKIKKHLGYQQNDESIEQQLVAIEDDPERLYELDGILTKADTALSNWELSQTEADEIDSGEGAVLNWNRKISIKKAYYSNVIAELSRVVGFPSMNAMLAGSGGFEPTGYYCG